MNKSEVLSQIISLKKFYADKGETVNELLRHFEAEMNRGELVWIEQRGKVIGFIDYSMISGVDDIEKAENGERTSGDILFILNCVCLTPGLLWRLKESAPPHRSILWRGKDNQIHPLRRRIHELV